MAMSLELMDTESGILVGSYETVEDALTVIRSAYVEHGKSGVMGLILLLIREDGSQQLMSEDLDLVRLALGQNMAALSS